MRFFSFCIIDVDVIVVFNYWKKNPCFIENPESRVYCLSMYAPYFFESAAEFRAGESSGKRVLTDADLFFCVVDVYFAVRHGAYDDGNRFVGNYKFSGLHNFRGAERRGQLPTADRKVILDRVFDYFEKFHGSISGFDTHLV